MITYCLSVEWFCQSQQSITLSVIPSSQYLTGQFALICMSILQFCIRESACIQDFLFCGFLRQSACLFAFFWLRVRFLFLFFQARYCFRQHYASSWKCGKPLLESVARLTVSISASTKQRYYLDCIISMCLRFVSLIFCGILFKRRLLFCWGRGFWNETRRVLTGLCDQLWRRLQSGLHLWMMKIDLRLLNHQLRWNLNSAGQVSALCGRTRLAQNLDQNHSVTS